MTLRFTLGIAPRTKKTHSRIIGFGRPCGACGKKPLQKIAPSEQFAEFEEAALDEGRVLVPKLRAKGASLPITKPVHVKALFYRSAATGDVNGFQQALADVLQGERYSIACPKCKRGRTIGMDTVQLGRFELECKGCGHKWTANAVQAKLSRKGLGIIADDGLIAHWDGTRLMKDSARPRIEIEINVIEPAQGELL
jgi:hypothetical protein